MRQLLRRTLGLAVILSVMLSTLGQSHAPCDGMDGMAAPAGSMGEMGALGHAMGDGPTAPAAGCEHARQAPEDDAGGPTTCLLVAHCVTAMIAGQAELGLETRGVQTRGLPADDTGPRELALEPDSPPPRG